MENVILVPGFGSEYLTQDVKNRLNFLRHPKDGLNYLRHLKDDVPVCDMVLDHFGNGETRVELSCNIRNRHVILIAQMRTGFVNDDFMSLVMLIDACRRSAASKITVVMPYYPYSRSDKKDKPRVPIGSAAIASILNGYNVDNVISLDLHAGQTQGLIDRGFHNLYVINLVIRYLKGFKNFNSSNSILISPDIGGVKRIEAYSKKMKIDHVILHKIRDYDKPGTVMKSIIIGDPKQYQGKTGVIIDDMADSMGTMVSATNELRSHGIKNVIIIVTHGIFSGKAIERINDCDFIENVICTDSLPQGDNISKCKKLIVLPCSILIGDALDRIINGGSVSSLFE